MNPLVELHERLVYSAVAGTALLEDDFRLKKLMDAFAPLAQKNPVFAKIYSGLQQLFGAEEAQRGKLLLNLLGLVDAVLYTQAGYGAEGELITLPDAPSCGTLQQIGYSKLKPLIDALTTTGSGRIEVLQEVLQNMPQYLSDARIIKLLISDLGDPYKEMGALIFQILTALGKGARSLGLMQKYQLPQIHRTQLVQCLKDGFDPKGKMDMAKRVSLIGSIAKEKENDWYISLLETAENEVREHVILALGYHKENVSVLLELTKSEGRKAKEMAYRALGQIDLPEVDDFWQKNLSKRKKFAEYVTYVKSDGVADIVAKRIREAVEAVIARAEMFPDTEEVAHWCNALVNKCSDAVFELYRWLFGTETDIHHLKKATFYALEQERKCIEDKVCETLVLTYPQKLVDFLTNFSETHAGKMERACFVADLLTLPANQVYEKWAHGTSKMLYQCFEHVVYQDGTYLLDIQLPDYLTYTFRTLKQPLDPRWFAHMVENDCLNLLERLLPLEEASVCQMVGKVCYEAYCNRNSEQNIQVAPGQVANCVEQTLRYLHIFQKCHMPNPQGLILVLCKRQPQISTGHLQPVFAAYQTYAGAESTDKEAKLVLQFYRESNHKSVSMIEKMRDMMLTYGFLTESV